MLEDAGMTGWRLKEGRGHGLPGTNQSKERAKQSCLGAAPCKGEGPTKAALSGVGCWGAAWPVLDFSFQERLKGDQSEANTLGSCQ